MRKIILEPMPAGGAITVTSEEPVKVASVVGECALCGMKEAPCASMAVVPSFKPHVGILVRAKDYDWKPIPTKTRWVRTLFGNEYQAIEAEEFARVVSSSVPHELWYEKDAKAKDAVRVCFGCIRQLAKQLPKD